MALCINPSSLEKHKYDTHISKSWELFLSLCSKLSSNFNTTHTKFSLLDSMYINLRVEWYVRCFYWGFRNFSTNWRIFLRATEILIPPENGEIWEAATYWACCWKIVFKKGKVITPIQIQKWKHVMILFNSLMRKLAKYYNQLKGDHFLKTQVYRSTILKLTCQWKQNNLFPSRGEKASEPPNPIESGGP